MLGFLEIDHLPAPVILTGVWYLLYMQSTILDVINARTNLKKIMKMTLTESHIIMEKVYVGYFFCAISFHQQHYKGPFVR